MSHAQARAYGILIHQELVVIPSQPCADRPIAQANLILHERALLKVWLAAQETERGRRVGIKLREVRNLVAEVLVKKGRIGFDPGLPFLPAMMNRNTSLEISFAKIVVLESDDRRGIYVRVQIVGVVANHPAEIAYNIRRKNMLIGNDSHCFEIVRVLKLGPERMRRIKWIFVRSLLHLLVGDFVSRECVAHREA